MLKGVEESSIQLGFRDSRREGEGKRIKRINKSDVNEEEEEMKKTKKKKKKAEKIPQPSIPIL